MLAGWLLLFVLVGLAALASLAVARRAGPEGRAELGVIAFVIFFALLGAPVLVLGYTEELVPWKLASLSAFTSGAVFVACAGRALRSEASECLRAARSMLAFPRDAVRVVLSERSLVLAGLVMSLVILGGALLLTILAPNGTWDGFLYHETIVGFAIQNHGFAIVDLPMTQAVQATNGYPHLCESLSIFLVIFTDKTLVELPSLLGTCAFVLAAYALCRRFADSFVAVALSCTLVLFPQVWSQLCQTYIDNLVGFFTLVCILFGTRPTMLVRHAWLALLGALLLVASKSSGLTTAPALMAIVWGRLVFRRRLRDVATAVVGMVVLAAASVYVPLRDWREFHDPLWPVGFDSDLLGIHWKGLITLRELTSSTSAIQELNVAYDHPSGGPEDLQARGYGYAYPWIIGPLAVIGAAYAVACIAKRKEGARALGLLLLALAASIFTAPSLNGHNARYVIHIVACVAALAAYALAQAPLARLRVEALAVATALSVLPIFWMRGVGWYWVSTKHLEDVLRHPLASRVVLARPEFDTSGGLREAELGPGDAVVFDENVSFVGALWNFHYSNRVRYVHYAGNPKFFDEIARPDVKWVVVGESDDARRALEQRGWRYVAAVTPETSAIYRKR